MRSIAVAAALAAAALAAGATWQDAHVRLDRVGRPADQRVVARDESPYTSMAWVASTAANHVQLRFFDRVEGAVALRPTWADLVALAAEDPRLAHLVPDARAPLADGAPDPGSVTASPYLALLPAGILLGAHGDAPRDHPWRVLVVGLGGGAGITTLAHHFPGAAITVVDIDDAVLSLVRDHYPLLAWLETRRRADGLPRVRLVARDARRFVRDEARAGRRYDLVVLDAYTAGATIPPHLMTREFFAECGAVLADGGVVMANVVGSYRGPKRLVVGGALRSLRAALPHAWSMPVFSSFDHPGDFRPTLQRNHVLFAARHPIDPREATAAWDRLRAFTPFPELPAGRWLSRTDMLTDARGRTLTTLADAARDDAAVPALAPALRALELDPELPRYFQRHATQDRALVLALARAAADLPHARGWRDRRAAAVVRTTTDAILLPREVWRVAVAFAARADVDDPAVAIPDAPLFTDQMPNADILNR